MAVWLALLAAPSVMLTNLSVSYALSAHACNPRIALPLHASSAISAAIALILSFVAAANWRQRPAQRDLHEMLPLTEGTFVPAVATAVAALSSLVIFAQWLAVWILPHCLS